MQTKIQILILSLLVAVLGCAPCTAAAGHAAADSVTLSAARVADLLIEEAYRLSSEADFWLHPGWCSSKKDLESVNPLFSSFPAIGREVWNNTALSTEGGGNAFWESGPVRPDIILSDLRTILSGQASEDSLTYYIRVK